MCKDSLPRQDVYSVYCHCFVYAKNLNINTEIRTGSFYSYQRLWNHSALGGNTLTADESIQIPPPHTKRWTQILLPPSVCQAGWLEDGVSAELESVSTH